MKKIVIYTLILLPAMVFIACQEEFELSGTPPTEDQAAFSFAPSEENDNIFVFTASESTSIKRWDLGNGSKVEGSQVTGIYPLKGTYSVTLTLYTNAGSVSHTEEIEIAKTDPTLLDKPIFNMLTGGVDAIDGKVWVVDSARSGHFGLGPNPSSSAGDIPEWYAAGANEKAGGGMYDDRYVFKLADFKYTMETNGDVYINEGQGSGFPGSSESSVGDLTAPFTAADDLTWAIVEPAEGYPELTINGNGFIGYYTGVKTYQIVNLAENELFLRYLDNVNEFAWYLRLIPAGYDPNAEEPEEPEEPSEVTLPLDFESLEPSWEVFGGSTFNYVDNPDPSGINTSTRVLETTHGGETWAGLYTSLSELINMSNTTMIALKVWAPQTGMFRLKLENPDNSEDFIEIDQPVDVAEEWVELSFDIAEAADRNLSNVVVFPGWDVSNAGTFYLDDIHMVVKLPLTFDAAEPAWEVFGGSTYSYLDNPDPSGINTSSRVLETTHGGETWAGLFTNLSAPIDLSESTVVSLKVWAPQTGIFRFKLENPDNSDDVLEVDQSVDVAEEWVELTFDIAAAADRNLSRVVIFPGWDVSNAGIFYVDDIKLAE